MITNDELRISNESYTHKDFYQIYPEILELVTKITERWDPASSNESDPGVVLLKLLAFIADKTNYNIDKNILECFMPSATQEDSMRKLCEMMGYNMKYNRSASVAVSFMWVGNELPDAPDKTTIKIPRFTEVTNDDGDIVYTLIENVSLTYKGQTVTKEAIEGKLCDLIINGGEALKLYNLDDNKRFYFPESQVAENGVFIWSIDDAEDATNVEFWKRKENLNIEQPHQRIWKFGYDSRKKLPYIQFPEDIAELIGNGLRIKYIRTLGANGNITAKTLTKISETSLEIIDYVDPDTGEPQATVEISDGENTFLNVQNQSYTLNGQDVETLDEAYNGFKKTVGTFDTLVTCRDYANKIYQLVYSDVNRTPLVSNVQVGDITNDINFANTIVTFDDFGLIYSDIPFIKNRIEKVRALPPIAEAEVDVVYFVDNTYYKVVQTGLSAKTYVVVTAEALNTINNFDLYIYPLNYVSNYYKAENYEKSFKPNHDSLYEIIQQLTDYKTVCHNLKQISDAEMAPGKERSHNIYAIKNYYHLNAKISTTYKVTEYEGNQILTNIYYALWHKFNARQLDYGEEIPFETLLDTIKTADSRIKVVALDEPELTTAIMFGDGTEASFDDSEEVFNRLVAKNVLAGRVPLFNYDQRFKIEIGQTAVNTTNRADIYGKERTYFTKAQIDELHLTSGQLIPCDIEDELEKSAEKISITAITTELEIPTSRTLNEGYTLKANENVELLAPNLVSTVTYPMYVNYYFHSPSHEPTWTTRPCRLTQFTYDVEESDERFFRTFIESDLQNYALVEEVAIDSDSALQTQRAAIENITTPHKKHLWILKNGKNGGLPDPNNFNFLKYEKATEASRWSSNDKYYKTKDLTEENWASVLNFFVEGINTLPNVFIIGSTAYDNIPGYLVDSSYRAFKRVSTYKTGLRLFVKWPNLHGRLGGDDLGVTESGQPVEANTEYMLATDDVLYINYTDSDDVIHNVEYFFDAGLNKYCYTDSTMQQSTKKIEFSGIIKPSFDLYASPVEKLTRKYSKTDKYLWDTSDVPGMFALQGQDQIEIRDFVNVEIKESPFYCYWSTNNNNTIKFKKTDDSKVCYTYTLENDEYFFYTDSLKNSLNTLASGTTLSLRYKVSDPSRPDEIVFRLNRTEVSLDNIASDGIGAFSDTDWNSFRFSESYYLKIEENQLINLAEKDNIQNVSGLTDNKITSEWKNLSAEAASNIRYNGKPLTKFEFREGTSITWQIRAVLNLDIAPDQGQVIESDQDVVQRIILYTSVWKDAQGRYITYEITDAVDLDKLTEEVWETNPVEKFESTATNATGNDISIRCNSIINMAGGKLIPVHRYTVEGIEKDDLSIYQYRQQAITGTTTDQTGEVELNLGVYDETYLKASLSKINTIKLPVYIPKGYFGLIMFYYVQSEETAGGLTISCPGTKKGVSLYKDNYMGADDNYYNNLIIKPGINIVRIKRIEWEEGETEEPFVLTLNVVDHKGSITFSDIDIVKIGDTQGTGINYKLLGISKTKCQDFVKNYIIDEDVNNLFYYNSPINNYHELDIQTFDEYSWFNYNNVCNRFTIAQLDSDFSDIQIAKSSRVTKW